MHDDDNLCLCFHVSVRKLKSFIRHAQPRRESQLSECFGAGTGCGWCRPYLKSLFEEETSEGNQSGQTSVLSDMSSTVYADLRAHYRKSKRPKPGDPT